MTPGFSNTALMVLDTDHVNVLKYLGRSQAKSRLGPAPADSCSEFLRILCYSLEKMAV